MKCKLILYNDNGDLLKFRRIYIDSCYQKDLFNYFLRYPKRLKRNSKALKKNNITYLFNDKK